jgi:hypothetical protein
MSSEKKKPWPEKYEPPRLYHIETGHQQALGATQCSTGQYASGGSGACSNGDQATGAPGEPNACATGDTAHVGPGHGMSPCGHGISAQA